MSDPCISNCKVCLEDYHIFIGYFCKICDFDVCHKCSVNMQKVTEYYTSNSMLVNRVCSEKCLQIFVSKNELLMNLRCQSQQEIYDSIHNIKYINENGVIIKDIDKIIIEYC